MEFMDWFLHHKNVPSYCYPVCEFLAFFFLKKRRRRRYVKGIPQTLNEIWNFWALRSVT